MLLHLCVKPVSTLLTARHIIIKLTERLLKLNPPPPQPPPPTPFHHHNRILLSGTSGLWLYGDM